MFFDFDKKFSIEEFMDAFLRPKNVPIIGPSLHKAFHGPSFDLDFNYSEEDLAASYILGRYAIGPLAARVAATIYASRKLTPWALGFYALTMAGKAYGDLTPEQKKSFDMHRHRSR